MLCIVHMHCGPVSVVSEYVWVSVFMCSCASEPICTMSVCVYVGGCMDSCPLSGFFLQLKIATSIRGRRARLVTMATAFYLGFVILMCRTGRLFGSSAKIRELSFERSGHGVNHKKDEGDKHLSGR